MTTEKDDDRTYVRVGDGPFRETSEAMLRIQAEMDTLRANIAMNTAGLQTTKETERARRVAFRRMYTFSSISMCLLIVSVAPAFTFILALVFGAPLLIGACSMLIGAVREHEKSRSNDTELMLQEEGTRVIASVIFATVHFTCLYSLDVSWLVWLLSLVYYCTLLIQSSFRGMYIGRNNLLLEDLLTKAQKQVERLVSDPPGVSSTVDKADVSHGVGSQSLALKGRR